MHQPNTGDISQPTSVQQQADDAWFRSNVDPDCCGIADRKRLEIALVRIAEDQLCKVGRDLHDDLCSQLSGIGCLTKMLESQLRKDQQQEARLLSEITGLVAHAGQTAREIAQELVPSVLEIQGLVGALRDLAARQQRRYGMNCALELGDLRAIDDLETMIGIQIYRIAQEAVSNAVRHSDANRIVISLSSCDSRIDLSVADDGKGMAEDLISIGMGLITMKRRAELIHANFSVQAALGAGATIQCSIPLPT